jgi:signal transduction histidine kinase
VQVDLEELRLVADELPVAIWMGRVPSGDVVYTNRAFREVLGIEPPPGAARGGFVEPYGVHTPTGEPYPEDRMPFEQVIRARATVIVDDLVIHRRDGRKVNLRVFAKPIFDADGTMTHVLEAFIDITREIEAERARAEGERRLALSQRLESIGQLVAGIAHDFNNLLTVTKLVVTGLASSEPDRSRRDALEQVDSVTDSAVRLIKGLLRFARRGEQHAAPIAVDNAVRALVDIAGRTIDRRITVRTELGAPGGTIFGDRTQIDQVLMNLLVNARDAIDGAGEIVVRTRPQGEYVVIEVADTGSGIPPEIRDHIFEPYFTTKTWGALKGTGLGLATVHGIVQGHGGTIEVADNVPRGTVMRVLLPTRSDLEELPETVDVPLGRKPAAPPRGAGRVVLVVDDEPLVRQSTAASLRGFGYEVLEAGDGATAIEIFRNERERISAVLLDMVMPGLGGREVYLALRELRRDVPVVLITGTVMNAEIHEMHELGVRTLLPKPYDAEQLGASLRRAGAG